MSSMYAQGKASNITKGMAGNTAYYPVPKGLNPALAALDIVFKPSARRKSLGIKVRGKAVIVASPQAVAEADVVAWVNSHSAWILKKANAPRPAQAAPKTSALTPQCSLFWQGQKIALNDAKTAGLTGIDTAFFALPLPAQKKQLLAACAQAASTDLPARLEHWQSRLGLYAKAIKLRPYKSCWGSCNHKGLVALNTLLMMAPAWVRDYVVIHELSHLKHMNHSSAFWRQVAVALSESEVRAAKQWLKVHSAQLLIIYR